MSPIQRPTREEVTVFPTAQAFRGWLEANHDRAQALFVGFYKKASGTSAMAYEEAVDEALCFGWIDGITFGIDDELRATRFTPRRRTSNWSAINLAKIEALRAAGRLHPAGIRAFEERDPRKDQTYSYLQPETAFPADWLARFRADAAAWEYWQSAAPSYRRGTSHWVMAAKRPETRERRFATLVADAAAGRRIRPHASQPRGTGARDLTIRGEDAHLPSRQRFPARYPSPMIEPPGGVRLTNHDVNHADEVLTPEALGFVAQLHRAFNPERERLLADRAARQARLDAGELPDFLPNPIASRDPDWRVAPAPPDLDDRRVEITGPAEPKMMINALNSGASVFMCDFEDALSPTWSNVVTGHWAVGEAVRRRLTFETDAKTYALDDQIATLVIRPRGWHLAEAHVLVDGAPVSASLFDFGIWFFHNAGELLRRGSGPYLYLPKLESHLEAALWNRVFVAAQAALGVPHGSVRATVLIETILAAFEMDEILYELRDHAAGLNAGRWDYIFSVIKKFRAHAGMVLPDRAQVTMTVPFMRAYTELLVRTCHRRGAHAIGGMAAFIPSRRDAQVNAVALARVREDKERESRDGFDGTWVAHPDLVPVAREVFDAVLGERPHQKDRLRPEVAVGAAELIDVRVPGGAVTTAGVRANISVGLAYLASWLSGNGAAAINNMMEDAATAEISRSQLWQWRVHGTPLDDGMPLTAARYAAMRDEELTSLRAADPHAPWTAAAALLDELVMTDDFADFLTVISYARLG